MGQVDFRDSVGAMPPALPSRGYGSVPARAGLCDVPNFAGAVRFHGATTGWRTRSPGRGRDGWPQSSRAARPPS